MRLVNVHSLKLETFANGQPPPYAILSHRWGETELSFDDLSRNRLFIGLNKARKKAYDKLTCACRLTSTLRPLLRYLWIDTCCIDKSSSSELSEAINSMYRWYREAEVCLAFLEDVEEVTYGTTRQAGTPQTTDGIDKVRFEKSVWFTRAWTLQELLAPRDIHFFNGCWQEIGTRQSLVRKIVDATGIPTAVLLQKVEPRNYSIASRMSWAAHRNATRIEDLAYSLLGIFDVNMALLYGEREKAFIRLQEEIIKQSLDRSFLLWGLDVPSTQLLAASPTDFTGFDDENTSIVDVGSQRPFALTNAGLEVELELMWWHLNTYAAKIAGVGEHVFQEESTAYYILLRPSSTENFLYRVGLVKHTGSVERTAKPRVKRVTILRYQDHYETPDPKQVTLCGFEIHKNSLPIQPYVEVEVREGAMIKEPLWHLNASGDLQQCILSSSHHDSFNAQMRCQLAGDRELFILASFDFDFNPLLMFSNAPLNNHYWAIADGGGADHIAWKARQWAKVATLPPKDAQHTQRYACKSMARQGAYVTLPEFLTPPGWRIMFYMDFIEENQQDPKIGMWQIAIAQREDSPHKSLGASFASDAFFMEEVVRVFPYQAAEKRLSAKIQYDRHKLRKS